MSVFILAVAMNMFHNLPSAFQRCSLAYPLVQSALARPSGLSIHMSPPTATHNVLHELLAGDSIKFCFILPLGGKEEEERNIKALRSRGPGETSGQSYFQTF